MRNRMRYVLVVLVLVLLECTGCAVKEGKNLEATQKEEDATVAPEATMESTAEASEVTALPENVGTEQEEQEAYILTFEANTITGEAVTSACFGETKLTMMNVWATYCNPCLSEMPDLGEIANSYEKSEFQLIGIISDVAEGSGEEAIANAEYLIEETKADYPHLLLNQSLYSNLVGSVSSVPTTFFINSKGEVLGYAVGAQSKDTWVGLIEELLAEQE